MDYYDISPTISPRIGVWPGDVGFRRDVAMSFAGGDHLELSSVNTTLHVGAHADAPIHYRADGCDMASRSLHYYIGPCQVMRVEPERGGRIYPHHLKEIKASRILFHTGSFPNPEAWNADFSSLSPELVHYLSEKGVILVGIDTPSVDPQDSKALESHNAIADKDMAVLEGIVLDEVPEDVYTLVAPPLKLEAADASPVRAVLLPS